MVSGLRVLQVTNIYSRQGRGNRCSRDSYTFTRIVIVKLSRRVKHIHTASIHGFQACVTKACPLIRPPDRNTCVQRVVFFFLRCWAFDNKKINWFSGTAINITQGIEKNNFLANDGEQAEKVPFSPQLPRLCNTSPGTSIHTPKMSAGGRIGGVEKRNPAAVGAVGAPAREQVTRPQSLPLCG